MAFTFNSSARIGLGEVAGHPGVVTLIFAGNVSVEVGHGPGILRQKIEIPLPRSDGWRDLADDCVVSAAPASFTTQAATSTVAVDAARAFKTPGGDDITLQLYVAVENGYLHRVAYHVTVQGVRLVPGQ